MCVDPIETEQPQERPLAEVGIFDLIRAFQNILERFDENMLDLLQNYANFTKKYAKWKI